MMGCNLYIILVRAACAAPRVKKNLDRIFFEVVSNHVFKFRIVI